MTVADSMLSFITTRDQRLMRRVNRWRPPRWIRLWMKYATRGGDGFLWYSLGIILLIDGGRSRFVAVAAAGTAALIGIAVFFSLKRILRRKRPCAIEPHCWSTLLPPDQFSFPSGHTITAFSVVIPVAMFYPALVPFLLACALSVAASRVLLGMHFLSDVVAGALIGSLLGYVAFLVYC